MQSNDLEIAVISDIHGNRWALEAVLQDIKEKALENIINLGDCVYGPLDPAGTIEMIINSNMVSISGNEDQILSDNFEKYNRTVNYVRNNLSGKHLKWLRELPDKYIIGDEIIAFHGCPEDKSEYFLEKTDSGCVSYRSDREIKLKLGKISQPVVLCGHSHLTELRRFADGRIVLNPGSVGLQAFTDDRPTEHFVQNGSPHARYCILKRREARWHVEKVEVCYDWEAASRQALKNGRIDWADWLRTGRVCTKFKSCVS